MVDRLVCVQSATNLRFKFSNFSFLVDSTTTRNPWGPATLGTTRLHTLTVDVVFHPGEGDGALPAALTEPQQEGPGTLVAQQSLLPLLTDEAHDGPSHTGREEFLLKAGRTHTHTPSPGPHTPVVPERQQVSFDHIQDSLDPQPERERLLVGALLWDPGER